jgi:GT2 family glycosyltransferase
MTRPRVLIALTVYNGRDVVPAALASAARLSQHVADIDVLVLDDASPEPGFGDELAGWCATHGHDLYRSPRNLGIPRNVNLGLLAAMEGGYDHVVISNSDVIYSEQAIDQLVRTAESDPRIGSVTAWSTNVSIYSIPNRNPDAMLCHQAVADEIGEALATSFGPQAIDIPAGISFAMLIPVPVVRTVGLMDPVFGRGYCEETDWSRRSLAAGFRLTLGVGAFVYHAGGGSTESAGVLAPGATTVPANERIIDLRYPRFRHDVADFYSSGELPRLWDQATEAIIAQTAARHGYTVGVGLRPVDDSTTMQMNPVSVDLVLDDRSAHCTIDAAGFIESISGDVLDVAATVRARFGAPISVDLFDVGPWADRAADIFAGDQSVNRHRNYPARV